MKQTINFYDFDRAFIDYGRTDNFSYEGRKALFEWLEELEEDTGEELDLDVIALCCDFRESDYKDIAAYYNIEIDTCLYCGEGLENGSSFCPDCEQDNLKEAVTDYLSDNTMFIEVDDNTVIYQAF